MRALSATLAPLLRRWSRVVAFQGAYSLADRGIERDLLPMAKSLDITVTSWDVLDGGIQGFLDAVLRWRAGQPVADDDE